MLPRAPDPRLPSQSVDGDETAPGGFASAASAGEAPRPGGRPLPVLGGRVAGFASVTAFGFGHQSGLVGALNTAAAAKVTAGLRLVCVNSQGAVAVISGWEGNRGSRGTLAAESRGSTLLRRRRRCRVRRLRR